MITFKSYLTEASRWPTSIAQVDKILYELGLSNHALKLKINDDFSIDVSVDVDISDHQAITGYRLDKLPIKFNTIHGTFDCSSNSFETLEGAPNQCDSFRCSHNKLTTLVGGPQMVYGGYNAAVNNLTSLDGIAKYIGGTLILTYNPIESLKGIHKQIDTLNGWIKLPVSTTKNLLGLLKIKQLHGVVWMSDAGNTVPHHVVEISRIIGQYTGLGGNLSNSDIMKCQEELLDAGFDEAAQL